MPNWGAGHSKALEMRETRKTAKQEQRALEEKRKEDAKWVDEVTQAKLVKKDDAAAKKSEKLLKKAELRKLVEEEEKQVVASNKKEKEKPAKLTRAQIQQRALLASIAASQPASSSGPASEDMLVENPNRLLIEERAKAAAAGQELLYASSVSEFLAATDQPVQDRAPEKRMRAAHAAYEEEWMPRMREEFPSLKRSQLKDKIWKQWLKAPENPMNQVQSEANALQP